MQNKLFQFDQDLTQEIVRGSLRNVFPAVLIVFPVDCNARDVSG